MEEKTLPTQGRHRAVSKRFGPASEKLLALFRRRAKNTKDKSAVLFGKFKVYTKNVFKKVFNKPEIVETYQSVEMTPAELDSDLVDPKVANRYKGTQMTKGGNPPDESIRQQRMERRRQRKLKQEQEAQKSEVKSSGPTSNGSLDPEDKAKAQSSTSSTSVTKVVKVQESKEEEVKEGVKKVEKKVITNPLFDEEHMELEADLDVKPELDVEEDGQVEAASKVVVIKESPKRTRKKRPSQDRPVTNPLFADDEESLPPPVKVQAKVNTKLQRKKKKRPSEEELVSNPLFVSPV